jgi:hypothetical protein
MRDQTLRNQRSFSKMQVKKCQYVRTHQFRQAQQQLLEVYFCLKILLNLVNLNSFIFSLNLFPTILLYLFYIAHFLYSSYNYLLFISFLIIFLKNFIQSNRL